MKKGVVLGLLGLVTSTSYGVTCPGLRLTMRDTKLQQYPVAISGDRLTFDLGEGQTSALLYDRAKRKWCRLKESSCALVEKTEVRTASGIEVATLTAGEDGKLEIVPADTAKSRLTVRPSNVPDSAQGLKLSASRCPTSGPCQQLSAVDSYVSPAQALLRGNARTVESLYFKPASTAPVQQIDLMDPQDYHVGCSGGQTLLKCGHILVETVTPLKARESTSYSMVFYMDCKNGFQALSGAFCSANTFAKSGLQGCKSEGGAEIEKVYKQFTEAAPQVEAIRLNPHGGAQ